MPTCRSHSMAAPVNAPARPRSASCWKTPALPGVASPSRSIARSFRAAGMASMCSTMAIASRSGTRSAAADDAGTTDGYAPTTFPLLRAGAMNHPHIDAPDALVIAGKLYGSRLLTGTAKSRDFDETGRATLAAGADIVTVAIRGTNLGQDAGAPNLLDALPPSEFTLLPNTAGCYKIGRAHV